MANQNILSLTAQTGSANTTSVFYAVINGTTDTQLPWNVFVNSLGLTGTPTVPTATTGTNTTQIASTAFVQAQISSTLTSTLASYAPLASPTFTGTVVIPTVTLSGGAINSTTIGATTPSTGAFTTLSVSSTVSGAGFSTYLASPPAIGGSVAAAGSFTTLSSTSTFTPSQTAGIVGTTTTNNANVGSVGEYVTATGTAVSLTTSTPTNIASISLTAGDWDVWGTVEFLPAATTTVTVIQSGINTTSAAIPAAPNRSVIAGITFTPPVSISMTPPKQRLSLASATTVYLVVTLAFGTSTATATGRIDARRRR